MPINIIKNSWEYCSTNKPFFVFLVVLLFICNYLMDLTSLTIFWPIVINILMLGYGLQVTENVIHGGTTLPKILPRRVLLFGIKGYIVTFFYVAVQTVLLALVSENLNFPTFEVEELILNYHETIHLFLTHDWVSGTIFIISGFVILYLTSFFMEIAIARLADGGKLKNAFNFPRIKRAIDIIGWKDYSIGYTKIILSVVILTYLINYVIPVDLIDTVVDTFLYFLIFVIEFIGMGHVYKVYIDNKPS